MDVNFKYNESETCILLLTSLLIYWTVFTAMTYTTSTKTHSIYRKYSTQGVRDSKEEITDEDAVLEQKIEEGIDEEADHNLSIDAVLDLW